MPFSNLLLSIFFFSLGSTCNHIAALLFKVDYAWQQGLTSGHKVACTSKENEWISPILKDSAPVQAADMVFEKPHYASKKRSVRQSHAARKLFSVARTLKDNDSPSLDSLTAALYISNPSAVAFKYSLPDITPTYAPFSDVNVACEEVCETSVAVPLPLHILARSFKDCQDMCTGMPTYSDAEVRAIEEVTKDQSTSSIWIEQRKGRITASIAHRTWKKTTSLIRNPENADASSLLKIIMGQGPSPDLPALKYGRQTEPLAVEVYHHQQKQHHSKFQISTCGLFVHPQQIYLAATPDRLVSCDCCGEGLLEVKCPISMVGKNASEVTYLKACNGSLRLNRNHEYYTQVQFQMGITGRKWCDFFIFTKTDNFIERIAYDEAFCQEVFTTCQIFFRDYVSKALFEEQC